MSLNSLAREIRESLLRFLWRQWSQIGVAGAVEFVDRWIIDPEALLVFTLSMGRRDARLFDEVLDWMVCNGRSISIQRLKNIADGLGESTTSRTLSAMAAVVDEHDPKARWSRLASGVSQSRDDREPFFLDLDGRPLPVVGEPDERFLRAGYVRVRPQLRGLSQSVSTGLPTNLVFRLRALFGLGPRAEILAYLLTHSSGLSSEVARSTAYSSTQVHEALKGLALADVVTERPRGRQRSFRTDVGRWLALLGMPESAVPTWVEWPRVFTALSALVGFLSEATSQPPSDYLLRSDIITLWPRVSSLLDDSGLPNPFAKAPAIEDAVNALADGATTLIGALAAGASRGADG